MSGAETTGARAGDGIAATGEREAFEAWAGDYHGLEDDHGYVNLRYLGLHKQYVDFDVQRAWEAWKASAALAAAPAAAPAQIPEDEISNPYRMSRGAAKIWLNGFRAGERAHGIQAPATVPTQGGAA